MNSQAKAAVIADIETIDIGAKTASAAVASSLPGTAAISRTTIAPVPASPCRTPIRKACRGVRAASASGWLCGWASPLCR